MKRTVIISALFYCICSTATPASRNTTGPSVPTNLTASLSSSNVNLSWSPSSSHLGVKAYNVIRNGAYVNYSLTTAYIDAPGPGTWTYQVLAYDFAGNLSALSSSVQITVPSAADTTPPSVPTNLSAVLSSSNVNLSWSPSTDNVGVKAYNVIRNSAYVNYSLTTSYTDAPGPGTWTYQVLAYDAAGNLSALSAPVQITVPTAADTTPPSVPTNLTAVVSSAQVSLSWSPSTDNVGVKAYNVIRNGAYVNYSLTTSYIDTPGPGAWTYQVLAYDAAGNLSALSAPVLATVTTTGTITPPSQATGYTLAHDDEFNTLDVGACWTGQTHQWYSSEYGQVITPSASQMSVSSSVLSLDWLAGMNNPAESSISSFDIGSQKGIAYRYGYYEARMKWSPVAGAWPAFWLLSLQSSVTNGQWGEIDIFEGLGNQPLDYFGTVHNWTAVNGNRTSSFNTNNDYKLPAGTDYSQWHTYGVLWEPGTITWYFDNQPIISAPEPAIMDTQDVELILGSQEGVNWSEGNTSGVSSTDIKLNVDWVRVWQKNPVTVTLPSGATASRGQ